MPAPEHRLPLLDYLRFAAALSVVSFHYFWNGIANGKLSSLDHVPALTVWAQYGYLGVDFFFMISGYVIFMSARRRNVSQFIVGRAVRLYPAYLVAMLTTACVAHWIGQGEMHVTLKQVAGNLFLYQPLHRQPFVDGVYWTLMIEINFYIGVALLILVGLQKHLETVFKAWPWLMLLALALGQGQRVMLGGYYAFFASGALFAILRDGRSRFALASLLLSTILSIRYALTLAIASGTQTFALVVTGLILVAFVGVFFAVNRSAGRLVTLPGSVLVGGMTYPLYLVHAHIGYMLLSRYATPEHRWLAYGATLAIVLSLALAIHLVVERRLAPFWRALFEGLVDAPAALVLRVRALIRPAAPT